MATAKIKVRFTENREVKDGAGNVIDKFQEGGTYELTEDSARHWLNRNAAVRVESQSQSRSAASGAADAKTDAKKTNNAGGDGKPAPGGTR